MTPLHALVAVASAGITAAGVDSVSSDPFSIVSNVTPAVVVGLFVAGVLRTRGEVTRLEAENAQLRTVLLEEAVPALARSADVQEETRVLLAEVKPLLSSVHEALRDLGRR